eukprot:jgi/Hompol1/2281/HPOL_005287-RA
MTQARADATTSTRSLAHGISIEDITASILSTIGASDVAVASGSAFDTATDSPLQSPRTDSGHRASISLASGIEIFTDEVTTSDLLQSPPIRRRLRSMMSTIVPLPPSAYINAEPRGGTDDEMESLLADQDRNQSESGDQQLLTADDQDPHPRVHPNFPLPSSDPSAPRSPATNRTPMIILAVRRPDPPAEISAQPIESTRRDEEQLEDAGE